MYTLEGILVQEAYARAPRIDIWLIIVLGSGTDKAMMNEELICSLPLVK